MFRIRSCTVYPIRMVYLSSSNRNVHLHVLHVHAIHVIHMLIQFMSYHSCDRDYSEKIFVFFIFSLFSICRGFPKTSEIRQLGCLRVGGPPGYSRIGSGAIGRRLIVLQRGTSRRGCSRPAATW